MSDRIKEHQFIEISDVKDVPEGKMKHMELNEKEIMLANADGRIYALCDRCSHMNAPLSSGTLKGNVVTCAMHGARFDITTGKKVAEPASLDPSKLPGTIPETLQKIFAHSAQLQSKIKTYDQRTYETMVLEGKIKVRI